MNQNKEIAVTANSPVAEMLFSMSKLYTDEIVETFPDVKSVDNVLKGVIPNYYKDWPQQYIIDRQSWGHPKLIEILKNHLANEIKIIVLVRPLEEVLASFIKLSKTTSFNYIKDGGDNVEQQCNTLMKENGIIDLQLKGIKNLLKFENRGMAHFVEYDNLVTNPQKQIDECCKFLGIPKFTINPEKITQLGLNGVYYNDSKYQVDLHKLRTDKIEKLDYSIEDYLPANLIAKAHSMNFWNNRY